MSKERREANLAKQQERIERIRAERKLRAKGDVTTKDEAAAVAVLQARGYRILAKR